MMNMTTMNIVKSHCHSERKRGYRTPDGFPACLLLLPRPLSAIMGLAVAGVLVVVWVIGLIIEWRHR